MTTAATRARRLSAMDQLRRNLLIGLFELRFRRDLRGQRWMNSTITRRRLR